jgi:hypothetical protein
MIDVALIHKSYATNDYTDLTSLGNIYRVDASQSLGKTIGSLESDMSAIPAFKELFDNNDSIDLYASYNKLDRSVLSSMYSNNTSAFLFSGKVNSINFDWSEGKENVSIVADDKTITLTNIIAERSYWLASQGYYIAKKGGDDTNSIIHQLVAEINERMVDVNGWDDITISDADIDETINDIEYAAPFKTYAEILTDLASGAYTGEVQYTYWIDATNALHWKKLGATKDGDLVYGTDSINGIKFKKDVYDTVNAAIVNAGVDLNGTGIWWYAVNYENAADVGFRWEILADTLFTKEFESILYDVNGTKGKGTATSVSGATLTDSAQSWSVNELANMWLINPNRGNSSRIVSNTSTTITANGEGWKEGEYYIYEGTNSSFREDMKSKAIARAQAELVKTARLRYRGDIIINGDSSRTLNQVYDFTMDYFGFPSTTPKKLRLTDVNHNFADGSWKTSLTLKEDIGTEGSN